MKKQYRKESSQQIRLCFVMAMAYPLFKAKEGAVFGGAEINMVNLALEFSEDPHYKVTFMVGDYRQEKYESYNNIDVIKLDYLNYDSSYKTGGGILKKIRCEIGILNDIIKARQDVYINSCGGGLLGRIVLAAKLSGYGKVIFRFANDLDTDPAYFLKIGEHITYILYKFGIHNTNKIICQTVQQHKMLVDKLGIEGTVIKNGFKITHLTSTEGKKYILWVARSKSVKRPELFVELAVRIPEKNFVMIMHGDNELKDEIRMKITGLKNITLLNYVKPAEIGKYYAEAFLFVNTSEYEGFPNTFIQACMASTPILSFMINPDRIIDEFNLGYCSHDSIDTAVDFIKSLSLEKINQYGNNALKYVASNHDINMTKLQYERIIKELIIKTG